MKKLGVLLSHPVQYYSPFFKELAKAVDLTVYYCYQPNSKEQGVGFGVAFQWDIPLLEGYNYEFINNAKEVKKRIKDGNFDLFIVIAWNYIAAHQALEACKSFNIPIYARGDSQLSTRPLWFRCLKRIYFSKFLSKFDGFLSPSQRFEEYLLFYGVSKDKIIFCPHFVDNNFFRETKFSSLKEKINTKKNYGFYENEILLLFCGKFIDKKRPLDFLHALKVLKEKKVNVGGLLVGDGILRKKMQDYSIKHKLNAVFLGFLNQREL
ncbi:MAG: glycosyltransferase, partial [Candidatus Omnitrophica bacterium]|nr:glycosyltransferase [Candidatus Omnitrophota bacterium]